MNPNEVFQLAADGRITEVATAVQQDPSLLKTRCRASGKATLAHCLAARKELGAVAQWITPDVIEEIDERGWTTAHVAAASGDLAALKPLLDQSQYLLHWADHRGQSPVHVALRHGHAAQLAGVRLGHLCQRDNLGQTPIHLAAQHGHLDQIVDLLTASALAMKNALNTTALELAKDAGYENQLPKELVAATEDYLKAEPKRFHV